MVRMRNAGQECVKASTDKWIRSPSNAGKVSAPGVLYNALFI